MNIYLVILITMIATACVTGLIFHVVALTKRIELLEKANLTAKGKLPNHVKDDLMDAIATVNYLRSQQEAENAYIEQCWKQLVNIRDSKVGKETRS